MTIMMSLPLEVVLKKVLMSDTPKGQGSTLTMAFLYPLKVVITLMDGFQRKVGSHLHLPLVHLHHQAEKVIALH